MASSRNVGDDLFPLTGKNEPEGDVAIDDGVSISDTWEGRFASNFVIQSCLTNTSIFYHSYDEAAQEQGPINWSVEFHYPTCELPWSLC